MADTRDLGANKTAAGTKTITATHNPGQQKLAGTNNHTHDTK